MKILGCLILNSLFLFNCIANSQSTITFDNKGWTSDQSIDANFAIGNFTFSGNKSLYTNYGYNFDVNNVGIYFAFQNPILDDITIKTLNNALINFNSLAAYQVSETGIDTLIIEGWNGSNKIYSTQFSNNNTWRILSLDYNGINKLIIKSGNSNNVGLFDYNFDNISVSDTTEIEPFNDVLQSYNLSQNFPNPFNPTTTISYIIPSNVNRQSSKVILKVYDILGNEVATLVDEQKEAGSYSVTFFAKNLSSGLYIYKLSTDTFVSTKKMMLLK